MPDIEFDREAVGVNAKRDWADADHFGVIGSGMNSNLGTIQPVALDLPLSLTENAADLQKNTEAFVEAMTFVMLELSDACAVLGSRQDSAIADMDATEQQGSAAFEEMKARLDGEQ